MNHYTAIEISDFRFGFDFDRPRRQRRTLLAARHGTLPSRSRGGRQKRFRGVFPFPFHRTLKFIIAPSEFPHANRISIPPNFHTPPEFPHARPNFQHTLFTLNFLSTIAASTRHTRPHQLCPRQPQISHSLRQLIAPVCSCAGTLALRI